jgi:hypothetical protein
MMKFSSVKNLVLALFVISVVYFTSIFPSCNVSTANISEVKLCTSLTGSECGGDMSAFKSDVAVVYCSALLKNAPSDTKVSFEWKHNDESIGKAEVKTESAYINSTFRPTGELPPGKYSVTVKIDTDNSTPVTKEFTIEE